MNKKLLLPLLGQPDPNVVKDVHLVGRYAVGITWGDEHGSIFPFDRLRRLCPCGACAEVPALPPAATWPRDIKRSDEGLRVTWVDEHTSVYPYADLRSACACAGCTGGH